MFTKTLEGENIICFANDWDSDPLSKKHIMLRLARKNRVLWVNSIGTRTPRASARDVRRAALKLKQFLGGCKSPAKNIVVFSPMAIPFHSNSVARRINRQWLRWSLRRICAKLGFRNPITWTFLPSTAGVAGALGEKLVVYHCVDEFSEFTGTQKESLLKMESDLIGIADAVIVSSGPLYETKSRLNPHTFLVTHGVDVEHFRKACDPKTDIPADLARLPRPVIGFFGLIADWVDLDLVRWLATERPNWSVVLIGKSDTHTGMFQGVQNVHLLGQKEYALLPAYCKGFSVAILPFARNALTEAANPLKLREYLAAGLPVVATAIPEAKRLAPWVRTAETREQFLEEIEHALTDGGGPREARAEAMFAESWDAKVAEMGRIVADVSRREKLPHAVQGKLVPEMPATLR